MRKKTIVLLSLGTLAVVAVGAFLWELDLAHWEKLDVSKIYDVQLATQVFDANDEVAGSLFASENRVFVSIGSLPSYVPEAFVAAEDARFYKHGGVDLQRIAGAVWHDVKTLSYAQGASTITQQLIKLTHLTSEKTLSRKFQEAILATQLERQLTKDQILEAYLNVVYFGNGAYGIGTAAEKYFGKSAQELTLGEASLLAGVIKSPSNYAPNVNLSAAKGRREYVLAAMVENGYITQAQADAAEAEVIDVSATASASGDYGWYVDEAAREAEEVLGISAEELLSGGYAIYTALDADAQKAAEATMEDSSYYPEAAAQGALIAMNVENGEVVALVGGREYVVRRGLNRATQSSRQPGSSIKPLTTYAAAVDRYGYVPTSPAYDVQRTYANGYAPGNAGGKYSGQVTLRAALSKSMNAATVDLADTVGVDAIVKYAKAFGLPIDSGDRNLALALGSMTYGVTPEEMCTAYAALANGGTVHEAHLIRKIEDRYGNLVYEYAAEDARAVTTQSAYILTDMLKTAARTGTAKALSALPFPVAAKTGTAGLPNGDTSDAWTVAYTPEISVAVWMGLDSNANGGMAASVSGGGYAAKVCAGFLSQISQSLSGRDFSLPSGINVLLVDGYALENENRVVLASASTPSEYAVSELFEGNTDEMAVSDIWDTPQPVSDLTITSMPGETPVIGFTAVSPYAEYLVVRNTGGAYDIVGILSGAAGEQLRFTDTGADLGAEHAYSVIPRHKLLFEMGKLVTGTESTAVRYSPGGLLNGITNMFRGSDGNDEIESGEKSIFQ